MFSKPAELKDDYLRLLEDPRPLQDLGLVREASALQPNRPFAGKNIDGALAQVRLESILVAAIDKDKPFDVSGNLLEQLMESGGNLQSILDHFAEELLVGMDRMGLRLPIPFLVADFPLSYPFNAATVLRPDGALVLINRGLTDMVWFATKLFVATAGIQIVDGTARAAALDPLPFSKDQITESLAKVVLAYLRHKNAHAAERLLPVFGKMREFVVAHLINQCTKFVIAHEFGHIIAGHLTQDLLNDDVAGEEDLVAKVVIHVFKSLEQDGQALRLTSRRSESVGQRWVQEIAADQDGLRMLFAGLGSLKGERRLSIDPKEPLFEFTAAAPFFVFGLYRLITEVEKARIGCRSRILITDHPPSELREQFVKMTYEAWGCSGLPRLTKQVVDWFTGVQEQVVESAVRLSA
jgi:hypothetical protein